MILHVFQTAQVDSGFVNSQGIKSIVGLSKTLFDFYLKRKL